ncbi:hypothetical protein Tco_0476970, partial [Tanacetum coccineum]
MSYVKGAAFEAIQTAKRILKERKKDQSPRSEMYSSFSISFVSRETDSDRSVNRQLWSNVDLGCTGTETGTGTGTGTGKRQHRKIQETGTARKRLC